LRFDLCATNCMCSQVLLNGLVNAKTFCARGGGEAVGGGGGGATSDGVLVRVSADATGLTLEVLDDGPGLRGETFEQLTTDFGGAARARETSGHRHAPRSHKHVARRVVSGVAATRCP
jgi:hypothetical protein